MTPHSSTLAWKIPWTEEPGRLQSMGSLQVSRLSGFTFTLHFHALEKEMSTHSRVLAWRIPGMAEPGGLLSMASHRVGHDWSNLAAAADILTAIQGGTCAIIKDEYWIYIPDLSGNISATLDDMKDQVKAMSDDNLPVWTSVLSWVKGDLWKTILTLL